MSNRFLGAYVSIGKAVCLSVLVLACSIVVISQRKPAPTPAPTPELVLPTTPFPTAGLRQCDPASSELNKRIWYEYGAVYVSTVFEDRTNLPEKCVFRNDSEINANRQKIGMTCFSFGHTATSCLQTKAKTELDAVIAELGVAKVPRRCTSPTPGSDCTEHKEKGQKPFRINDDWAFRTYRQTVCNWLYFRKVCPKETPTLDVASITFPLDSNEKPLMFRAAMPGASQHHLGLGIDVNERGNPGECDLRCTRIMNSHGWYRTVRFDRYHFTFLGHLDPPALLAKGLKPVVCWEGIRSPATEYLYWVPNAPADYQDFKYVSNHCRTANIRDVASMRSK